MCAEAFVRSSVALMTSAKIKLTIPFPMSIKTHLYVCMCVCKCARDSKATTLADIAITAFARCCLWRPLVSTVYFKR